jgi:4-amino-4-deoxy-L-arabinose transferase-like glycosyltransferase
MRVRRPEEVIALAIVCLAITSIYMPKLGTFGVTDPGEGYYVEAAREMVERGDYITPHLNYQIYFSKPILTFWLIASGYLTLGTTEFAARLPFVLLAGLLFCLTYYLGRCLRGPRCGIFAALIAATAPLMIAFVRLSPIDIAFSCFLDIALFSISLAVFLEKRHWWIAAWISLALALLTKGPAALILTALGLIAFLVIERAAWPVNRERLKHLHPLKGLLIFAVISLPWYVAVHAATNGLFLKVFFLYENLARFSGLTNLARTTWFHYLIVLGYGYFPWAFLIPSALNYAFARGGKSFSNSRVLMLLASWSIAVFAFFSISKTQLDTYILPVIAPIAVLIAVYLDSWLSLSARALVRQHLQAVPSFLSGTALLFFVGFIAIPFLPVANGTPTPLHLGVLPRLYLAAILLTGSLCQWQFIKQRRFPAALFAVFTVLLATSSLLSQIAFEYLDESGQRDLRKLCREFYSPSHRAYRVAIFRAFKPSVMFYLEQPVDSFFHGTQIVAFKPQENHPEANEIILVHERTLPLLVVPAGTTLVPIDRCGQWLAYKLLGGQVQSVQTLEAIFKNPEAFKRSVSGASDWGPLTVPYGSGTSQN